MQKELDLSVFEKRRLQQEPRGKTKLEVE